MIVTIITILTWIILFGFFGLIIIRFFQVNDFEKHKVLYLSTSILIIATLIYYFITWVLTINQYFGIIRYQMKGE